VWLQLHNFLCICKRHTTWWWLLYIAETCSCYWICYNEGCVRTDCVIIIARSTTTSGVVQLKVTFFKCPQVRSGSALRQRGGDDALWGGHIYDCVLAVFCLMYRPMYIFGHMYTQLEVAPDGPERNWWSSRGASLFGRYPFRIPFSIPGLLLGYFLISSRQIPGIISG
jgi:hypothetical protein